MIEQSKIINFKIQNIYIKNLKINNPFIIAYSYYLFIVAINSVLFLVVLIWFNKNLIASSEFISAI